MQQPKVLVPVDLVELLEKIAQDRDRSAFAQLFNAVAGKLKAFAQQSGASPEEAEEICQEALLQVWNKAHSYDPAKAAANTWLFTIVRNKTIDFYRRGPKTIKAHDLFTIEHDNSCHSMVESDLSNAKLRNWVNDLPFDQRQVLHKAYFEDKSQSTIAADLDIPIGTVKSRLRLAVAKLVLKAKELM